MMNNMAPYKQDEITLIPKYVNGIKQDKKGKDFFTIKDGSPQQNVWFCYDIDLLHYFKPNAPLKVKVSVRKTDRGYWREIKGIVDGDGLEYREAINEPPRAVQSQRTGFEGGGGGFRGVPQSQPSEEPTIRQNMEWKAEGQISGMCFKAAVEAAVARTLNSSDQEFYDAVLAYFRKFKEISGLIPPGE